MRLTWLENSRIFAPLITSRTTSRSRAISYQAEPENDELLPRARSYDHPVDTVPEKGSARELGIDNEADAKPLKPPLLVLGAAGKRSGTSIASGSRRSS